MKREQHLSYEFLRPIDHKSRLAQFFNQVFRGLHLVRIISAPVMFDTSEKETGRTVRFYKTCLFEVYAHSVIPKMDYWASTIGEYLSVFDGSWEYYARSKRIELINEYGGNEDDYNADGSIKTDVFTKELKPYSVVRDLVNDDWQDIVTQTKYEDLTDIYAYLNVGNNFTIGEMFRAMGAGNIKSYRQENGKMVENTADDEVLHKISTQNKCEHMSGQLMVIVSIIRNISDEIKSLPYDSDNVEYFRELQNRIFSVLDMNISGEAERLISSLKEMQNETRYN